MAWFAVTSLMRTVELEFLPPNPRVVLDDTNAAEALHGRLRELLHFLEKSEDQFNADEDVAMQDWKARLKDVAMRIEDAIESKIIDSFRGGQGAIPLAQSFQNTLKHAIGELTKKFVKEDLQMKEWNSFIHEINDDLPDLVHKRSIGIANFKKLRVLDLSTLCFKWNLLFTNGGVDLVLLRYLALRIYSSNQLLKMWKFKESFNLQTLMLLADEERRVSYTTKVYEIWRMPMLRHLKFSPVFMFDTPNVVLEYLQTIYWLQPSQCTKEVFLGIRNVKVMGIFMPRRVRKFVQGLISSDDEYSLAENWLDDLINLQKLEKLKLNSDHEDPIILPHASTFPVQLKMLTLKGTLVPWDAMDVIGMLPNLEVLKLKSGACKGQHWKVSGGRFPKLKSLLIQGVELKQWTATDEDAFPILERLIVKHCIHLEKIPSTFVELYTFQLFELYGCQSLLLHFAKQIQQQQEELFGYNWLVVHDYDTHQVATIIEEKERVKRGKFDEQEHEKVATIIEEKEHENRGQQECKKLKYKASYPDSSYFARQVQEEEDSKLTNVNFYNCFEDDFDDNDIN
nr:putative late blight resistance protein homolog R1A-10 isoform X1 [Ipomoea batatas]